MNIKIFGSLLSLLLLSAQTDAHVSQHTSFEINAEVFYKAIKAAAGQKWPDVNLIADKSAKSFCGISIRDRYVKAVAKSGSTTPSRCTFELFKGGLTFTKMKQECTITGWEYSLQNPSTNSRFGGQIVKKPETNTRQKWFNVKLWAEPSGTPTGHQTDFTVYLVKVSVKNSALRTTGSGAATLSPQSSPEDLRRLCFM